MALSQVVTKTYGRRSRQADMSNAARTFDNVFSRPPARASSTADKWGKATFTRVPSEQSTAANKRKFSLDNNPDDPFSFDSDDDNSPRKKKKAENKHSDVNNVTGCPATSKRELENVRRGKQTEKSTVLGNGTKVRLSPCTRAKVQKEDSVLANKAIMDKDKKTAVRNAVEVSKRTLKNVQASANTDMDLEMSCLGDGFLKETKDSEPKRLRNTTLSSAGAVRSCSKSVNGTDLFRHGNPTNSTTTLSSRRDDGSDGDSSTSPNKDPKKFQVFVENLSQLIANKVKAPADGHDKKTMLSATVEQPSSSVNKTVSPKNCSLEPSCHSILQSDNCALASSRSFEDSSDCDVHLLSSLSPLPLVPSRATGRVHQSVFSKMSSKTKSSTPIASTNSNRLRSAAIKNVSDGKMPELSEPLKCCQSETPDSVIVKAADQRSTATRKLLSSSRKSSLRTKAVYNPRQWNESDELGSQSSEGRANPASGVTVASDVFDDLDSDWHTPPVSDNAARVLSLSGPSSGSGSASSQSGKVKVQREHKMLYTVVHNVKEAHECQEYGETQEFCDDIDYIMDGLGDSQVTATRCLSAISLASKCSASAFRMHIRAHDTFTKIFCALHDAPEYPSLALCTSAVMYMMSRDHLAMHIDQSSLQLMLRLLNVDNALESTDCDNDAEFGKIRLRIHEICSVAGQHHSSRQRPLTLDNITPGHLAMETLLSLTSKQAGDWFKDTLRTLGGLEQIVNTVCRCIEVLDDSHVSASSICLMSEQLQRVERCVRVLESVSYMNCENQGFLLSHKSSALILALHRLLQLCVRCLPLTSPAKVGCSLDDEVDESQDKDSLNCIMSSCLLVALRLLLNITHDNEPGSKLIGKVEGLLSTVLFSTLQLSQHVATSQRFDLIVLGIGLLTNLVEKSSEVRREFLAIKSKPPVENQMIGVSESVDSLESLGMLFSVHYEAAKLIEEEHDAELEEVEKRQQMSTDKMLQSIKPTSATEGKLKQQKGEWHESDSGIFWQAAADSSALDNSAENLAAMQACRQEAAMLAGSSQPQCSQGDDENYTKVLDTAGKHMEDSIMAAYIALLIGTLIQFNNNLAEDVRDTLPDFSFTPMVQMLSKFLGFMNLTSASGTTASKSIQKVIEILEAC